MKKEEKTECTCNNDSILKKVLIAFGCGVILGALITVGVFFAVRKADSKPHRLSHCNGHSRCLHTPIDDEYRFKYDSELELQDYLREKRASDSKKAN